jgi:ribosomal protein S18 acetylase RimI-like enzyme
LTIEIRKFRSSDVQDVKRICAETAVLGRPVEQVFDDRELASDVLVAYHISFEPESCFVAVAKGRVVGYLAGSVDSSLRRRAMLSRILPRLIFKAFTRRTAFGRKTFLLCKNYLTALAGGEFSTPDFSDEYPANLHINVEREFRNLGAGTDLLKTYLKYLRERNINGVMLSTKSLKAKRFFQRLGFKVLYERDISFMRSSGFSGNKIFIMGRNV